MLLRLACARILDPHGTPATHAGFELYWHLNCFILNSVDPAGDSFYSMSYSIPCEEDRHRAAVALADWVALVQATCRLRGVEKLSNAEWNSLRDVFWQTNPDLPPVGILKAPHIEIV